MEKRKNILKEKPTYGQRRVLRTVILVNVCISIAYCVSMYSSLISLSESALTHEAVIINCMGVSLFFAVVYVISNYYIALKVNEPMEKLVNYFKSVGDKQEVMPLSFRDSDFYKELPSLIIESYRRVLNNNHGHSEKKKIAS